MKQYEPCIQNDNNNNNNNIIIIIIIIKRKKTKSKRRGWRGVRLGEFFLLFFLLFVFSQIYEN